ncbi:MAG: hypothetical protein WA005_10535 [Candidatus Binataceae bacterium]
MPLILLSLTVTLSAYAQSPKPSPRPSVQHQAPLANVRNEKPDAVQQRTEPKATASYTAQTSPTAYPVEGQSGTQKSKSRSEAEKGKKPKSGWISWPLITSNRLMVFFNFWLMVASIALAVFTWQLVDVTRQLHKTTEEATDVSRENVMTAKAQAAAANATLEFAKAANEQNLRLATQSNDIALLNARSATMNVETSIRALHADRPYLLVVDASISGVHREPVDFVSEVIAAPKPVPSPFPPIPFLPGFLGAQVAFKNFGKGPAILYYVVAALSVVDALPEPKDFSKCSLMALTLKVISPDQPWTLPVATLPFFISEEDSKIVRQTKAKRVIVYGCVYYHDLLDQPYETGFCWAFEPRAEQGILAMGSVDKTIEISTHSHTK